MKQDNIPGYPGYYLDRKGNLWRFKEDKWVKVKKYISPKGYPHNLLVVMHLDNNPLNNLVSNLKLGTYKENTQQMMREGRNKGQFVSKLSQEQLKEVVRLYDSGKFTLKELSIKFNCKNMSRIVRRTKGEIVK